MPEKPSLASQYKNDQVELILGKDIAPGMKTIDPDFNKKGPNHTLDWIWVDFGS